MSDVNEEWIAPVFQNEYAIRVILDEGLRKVIAVDRPIGLMTRHQGRDVRLWTGSFIARQYDIFGDIYITPSNKSGKPLIMDAWALKNLGEEIYYQVSKLFEPPIYV